MEVKYNDSSFSVWGFENDSAGIETVSSAEGKKFDNVTIKFSGSGGRHADDSFLINSYNENSSNIPVILGGSSSDPTYDYLSYVREQMGVNYPPEHINFQGFSAGCKSATQALGMFINEQELNSRELPPQTLTLCDPGKMSENNYLFEVGSIENPFTDDVYQEQLKKLEQSGKMEQFVASVYSGNNPDFLEETRKELGITIPNESLVTYKAFNDNKPVANIFVGIAGNDANKGWGGLSYKSREDFDILSSVTEQTLVYKFDAVHSGTEVDGKDGINLIFDEIFKNQEVRITEEKLEEIINHPQFEEIGIYNKETDSFDIYTKDMLIDSEGNKTDDFKSIYKSASPELVDYDYISGFIDLFSNTLNKFSISDLGNIRNYSYGSSTIELTNELFHKFAINDINFLTSANAIGSNIVNAANSWQWVDKVLANSLFSDSSFGENINSLNNSFMSNEINLYDAPRVDSGEETRLKFTKEDLILAMQDSNPIISSLLDDIDATKNTLIMMNSFVETDFNKLSGAEWEALKNNMSELADVAQKKIIYEQNLIDAIRESYQFILNYMEEYGTLDTSMMEEIMNNINAKKKEIKSLEFKIAITPDYTTDLYGNIISDNTGLKAAWAAEIANLEEEVTELQRHYDKLEGLFNIDSQASNILLSAMANTPLPNFDGMIFSSTSFNDGI